MSKALQSYDMVFIGKAANVEKRRSTMGGGSASLENATFRVSKWWKPREQDDQSGFVETETETACCLCGMSVRRGAEYLIFANRTAGKYRLSICSPSRLSKYADQEMEILDKLVADDEAGVTQ